jgi:hypothetical protein
MLYVHIYNSNTVVRLQNTVVYKYNRRNFANLRHLVHGGEWQPATGLALAKSNRGIIAALLVMDGVCRQDESNALVGTIEIDSAMSSNIRL